MPVYVQLPSYGSPIVTVFMSVVLSAFFLIPPSSCFLRAIHCISMRVVQGLVYLCGRTVVPATDEASEAVALLSAESEKVGEASDHRALRE